MPFHPRAHITRGTGRVAYRLAQGQNGLDWLAFFDDFGARAFCHMVGNTIFFFFRGTHGAGLIQFLRLAKKIFVP